FRKQSSFSTERRTCCFFFCFNDPAITEIYTLSLHDALPIYNHRGEAPFAAELFRSLGYRTRIKRVSNDAYYNPATGPRLRKSSRSEEHTSELQSRGHLVCRLLPEKKKRHPPGVEELVPVDRQ